MSNESGTSETLEQKLERLDRERQEADTRYNDALTALDRSLNRLPDFPHPPPPYDASGLPNLERLVDLLSDGPPAPSGSLARRLGEFVWSRVRRPFESQRRFNAALVDHLKRNAAPHAESERAIATTIAMMREHIEALMHFQGHLIRYLQTVTWYVDTRDRRAAAGGDIVNAALSSLSDQWFKRWESLRAREARLSGQAESVIASLADLRATTALAQQTAVSLKREVERTLAGLDQASAGGGGSRELPGGAAASVNPSAAAATVSRNLDAFKYLGFENAFRGDPAEIRRRLESYVPLFAGASDVVDIGCGRGEFLELLRRAGVSGRGVDINAAMVEETNARGLTAEIADALSFLAAQPDASLGGIFAAQVVEHLEPDYLAHVLEEAARAIRPGGLLVLETINPTSWVAFFESYIRDLTHVRPLHPDTMQYLLRVSGFRDVRVEFRSPVDPLAQLQKARWDGDEATADVVAVVNDNVARLNARLFGAQDYAVIGVRP